MEQHWDLQVHQMHVELESEIMYRALVDLMDDRAYPELASTNVD